MRPCTLFSRDRRREVRWWEVTSCCAGECNVISGYDDCGGENGLVWYPVCERSQASSWSWSSSCASSARRLKISRPSPSWSSCACFRAESISSCCNASSASKALGSPSDARNFSIAARASSCFCTARSNRSCRALPLALYARSKELR